MYCIYIRGVVVRKIHKSNRWKECSDILLYNDESDFRPYTHFTDLNSRVNDQNPF